MLEDLTLIFIERRSGVKLTFRYVLKPVGKTGFRHNVDSIIGHLNKVFTRIGYKLSTDGITSATSIKSGSTPTQSMA